jgi:hypothetical protein
VPGMYEKSLVKQNGPFKIQPCNDWTQFPLEERKE